MTDTNSATGAPTNRRAKTVPTGAKQHATAGPYSPVLEVEADRIVVISGQVAVDPQGEIIGSDIESQTRATLANCRNQLASGGCTFDDVFKVNVYMHDLGDWDRFNAVYLEFVPEPRRVRTTIGAKLFTGFLIEIEMWAAKQT
jgi:2-iminobutanoate/2-iminopropanoate deaminase